MKIDQGVTHIRKALAEYEPIITDWDEPVIREFDGKKIVGRPTKAYGTKSFEYAGRLYEPEPWSISMNILKMAAQVLVFKEINKVVKFNFCLCGYYKDGSVSIPHHSDTVPTLDDIVVSISFGTNRIFKLETYLHPIKEKVDTSELLEGYEKHLNYRKSYLLQHGDVMIFDGHSQMKSTHAIERNDKIKQSRMNLTFRTGL
tara:strand:+ start:42 stop:644 length:603 start_codon:yes stop_codon:yes gene_type:complete